MSAAFNLSDLSSGGLSNIIKPTAPAAQPQQQGFIGPTKPAYLSGGGGYNSQSAIDLLNQQAANQLAASKNQYAQRSALLNNQLGDLGNQKQSLLDQIGGSYGSALDQAKSTYQANLDALNKSQQDTQTGYQQKQTDQGRLLNDTQRSNRQMARALGNFGSSFYEDNLQGQAAKTAADNITKLGQTEQSQLDQIAQQINGQNTDYGTKTNELLKAEEAAKNGVLNNYQKSYNDLQTYLNSNNADSVNQANQIGTGLQSSLANIANTLASKTVNPIANIAQQAQQLGVIQQVTQPLQDKQVLNSAVQQLQSDPSSYQNIVGQLKVYDAQNGTNLSSAINGLVTPANSGFLGIGASPAKYNGGGTSILPQTSYLDQLMQNLYQ